MFQRQPTDKALKLVEKYRPRCLDEVMGQPDVARSLRSFLAAPYSTAMLFSGDSGVGKTSAAVALACELGCSLDDGELGGVFEIPSGEMQADQVRDRLRMLHYRPLCGSGWRVLICNEADRMQRAAETIWLDGLEHLPPNTVVIFTTNEPERLSQRFRDRCEPYPFQGGSETLAPHIQELARELWGREVGGEMPEMPELGMPTLGGEDTMNASFRLAVQQLQLRIRDAKAEGAAIRGKVVIRTTAKRAHAERITATEAAPPPAIDFKSYGRRWEAGERMSLLASELGIPKETMHGKLRRLGFKTARCKV